VTALAGAVALVALAVTLASLAWLHLEPTGLSPLRNAVSQYGITPFKTGYRVATIAFAVAGAALALGLHHAFGGHGQMVAVLVALIVFTLARAAISWFPMDAPGAPRSSTGQTHGLLAIAAFGGATYAAFRLGNVLSSGARWHDLAGVSTAFAVAMLVCLLAMGLARHAPAVRAHFGVVERCFYLLAIAWFAVFASASL
jgi:hypothetical protein